MKRIVFVLSILFCITISGCTEIGQSDIADDTKGSSENIEENHTQNEKIAIKVNMNGAGAYGDDTKGETEFKSDEGTSAGGITQISYSESDGFIYGSHRSYGK